ncbi:hypothetical protein ACQP2T_63685 (plasmid) [Nonomuraea sp. CA-143628]|uniref:hypothetical protein n=1 Tax=Nonomuraea sp. CA-143628 TaxID=3239997 RepID=UPI003D943978
MTAPPTENSNTRAARGDTIASSTTARQARPAPSKAEAQFAVLEQTYPRWRIRRRSTGMWTATRVVAPTAAQSAAGLQRYLLLPTLDALAAALVEQFVIAQTVR